MAVKVLIKRTVPQDKSREMLALSEEYRLDFECGYITRSPCRECSVRMHLPDCSDDCRKIADLQDLLARPQSCSACISPYEEHRVSYPYGSAAFRSGW